MTMVNSDLKGLNSIPLIQPIRMTWELQDYLLHSVRLHNHNFYFNIIPYNYYNDSSSSLNVALIDYYFITPGKIQDLLIFLLD